MAALVAVLLVGATASFATNFAAPFANGSGHVGMYTNLTSAFASATDWNGTNNIGPTDMSWSKTTSHGASDVEYFDENYGDTGWSGLASCNSGTDRTGTICFHWHVQYNLRFTFTTSDRRWLACHETGHTVGLDRNPPDTSCMDNVFGIATFFGNHDKSHINSRY